MCEASQTSGEQADMCACIRVPQRHKQSEPQGTVTQAPFSVHPSFPVFGVTSDWSLDNVIHNVFVFKNFAQLLKEAFCKIEFAQPKEN